MSVLAHRDNTDPYVLRRQRHLDESQQTIFLLKPMTVREFIDANAEAAKTETPGSMIRLKVEIVRSQVKGWKNDKETWKPELVDDLLAGDIGELAERIGELSYVNEETAKN